MISFKRKVELNMEEWEMDDSGISASPPATNLPYGATPGSFTLIDYSQGSSDDRLMNTSDKGKTKILYLIVPLNISYKMIENRLSIGAGVSTSVLLASTQIRNQLALRYYDDSFTESLK